MLPVIQLPHSPGATSPVRDALASRYSEPYQLFSTALSGISTYDCDQKLCHQPRCEALWLSTSCWVRLVTIDTALLCQLPVSMLDWTPTTSVEVVPGASVR